MNLETKKRVTVCLKTAWLVAVVETLLMGMAVGSSSIEACIETGKFMFGLMFFLTFPISIFSFLFTTTFIEPSHVGGPSELIVGWVIMVIAGLLQWFIIIPNVAAGSELTTLELNKANPSVTRESDPRRQPIEITIVDRSTTSGSVSSNPAPVPSHRRNKRRNPVKSIAPFDRQGRTPLERVIARL